MAPRWQALAGQTHAVGTPDPPLLSPKRKELCHQLCGRNPFRQLTRKTKRLRAIAMRKKERWVFASTSGRNGDVPPTCCEQDHQWLSTRPIKPRQTAIRLRSAHFSYRNITVTDAPSARSQKGPKKSEKETVRNRTHFGLVINDKCRTPQLHSSSPVEVTPGAPRNKFRNKQMFMQFVVGPMSSPCQP